MINHRVIKSHVDDELFILPNDLTADHLADCILLPDRFQLIEKLPKHGKVAEVGTQTGEFAKHIMTTNDPQELHLFDKSFDQPAYPFDHSYFSEAIAAGRAVLHQGDSSTLLGAMPDGYFDWIYVDADHSFEGVSRDIAQATRKIKHHGLLVFDDYTIYSPLERIQYGVQRAVNDLILKENFKIIYFALSVRGYPDVCLRRKHSNCQKTNL
jgi:hypothetical protein